MAKYVFSIQGLPSDKVFNAMPFGRQVEYHVALQMFRDDAKHTHFSAKGKSTLAGFREFKRLYKPTQWFFFDRDTSMWHDDSTEVWYK